MRDDAGGGKAKQRQPSDTRCMCNAVMLNLFLRKENILCASRSRQRVLSSASLLQSQHGVPNSPDSSWCSLSFISEVPGTGRNRKAKPGLGVGSFVPNYSHLWLPASKSYFCFFSLLFLVIPTTYDNYYLSHLILGIFLHTTAALNNIY